MIATARQARNPAAGTDRPRTRTLFGPRQGRSRMEAQTRPRPVLPGNRNGCSTAITPRSWPRSAGMWRVWDDRARYPWRLPHGPADAAGLLGAVLRDLAAVFRGCGTTAWTARLGLSRRRRIHLPRMVAVFREVRRVLRDDGTVWLNLGDSYARVSSKGGSGRGGKNLAAYGDNYGLAQSAKTGSSDGAAGRAERPGSRSFGFGLKEKDLMMMPARVAIALQRGRLVSAQRHHLAQAEPDAGECDRSSNIGARACVPAVEIRTVFL